MGTHYETLGVKPSASAKEIRKAYLRRARALHPDRQLERSPADARRAEEAMQMVNVAWNVLSDSKKKADYDARLGGSGSKASGSRSQRSAQQRSSQSASRPRTASSSSKQRPQQRTNAKATTSSTNRTQADSSSSTWASIPVLIVIGIFLGVLIVVFFLNGGDGDDRPVIQADTQLIPGDCFVLVGNTPREIDCSTGNAVGQVTEVGPEPGNCPDSGQLPLKDPESDFYLCWAQMVPGSANTIP